MQNSIYKFPHHLREVLKGQSVNKVLYSPVEVGKYNLKTKMVNFFGDALISTFEFPYNNHGISFYLQKLKTASKMINAKRIFVGLESTGHYHQNFVCRLKSLGQPVEIINPFDTWKERDNPHAKTDKIDLSAIARVLIGNKGRRSIMPTGIYYQLQRAARTRKEFIRRKVSSMNIITTLVDRVFPTLWDKDNTVFSDRFGKASLFLLSHYPHPSQVLRLGEKRLTRFLVKNQTKLGEPTAKKIIEAAKLAPVRDEEELEMDILALKQHIKSFLFYQETISSFEKQMARFLVQTPGIYLLSIPGIGLVLAANLTAEIGDIDRFSYAGQLVSLAGLASKKSQSADYESEGGHISRHGNKFLRCDLNQVSLCLNRSLPDFHRYYARKREEKRDRAGIARIATGNKALRLFFCLMKNRQLYKPPSFDLLLGKEKEYFCKVYQEIIRKLSSYELKDLIPEKNYLSKIKEDLEKKYSLKL